MKNPLKEVNIPKNKKDFFRIRKKYIPLSTENYFKFCRKYGFEETNEKSIVVLKKERELYYRNEYLSKDEKSLIELKKNSKRKKQLKSLKDETLRDILINSSGVMSRVISETKDESVKEEFFQLVIFLKKYWKKLNKKERLSYNNEAKRMIDNNLWTILMKLARVRNDWIRDLESYKPSGHNVYKIVFGLVNHLLVSYDIPKGLYSLLVRDTASLNYFVEVAKGNSPKNAIPTSIKIPKARASRIILYLKKYNWMEAIRRVQGEWIGLDKYFMDNLWKVADFKEEGREDLKYMFMEYMSRHGMVDVVLIGPLWDYTKHIANNYERENRKFSFKGRIIFNYIQLMEQWHRDLNEMNVKKNFSWEASDYKTYKEKRKKDNIEYDLIIRELTSSAELHKEGKKQKHCVGSYARSCKGGNTSIWSIREEIVKGEFDILATIEVRSGAVVQAKASCNRPIGTKARAILDRWAANNDIRVVV